MPVWAWKSTDRLQQSLKCWIGPTVSRGHGEKRPVGTFAGRRIQPKSKTSHFPTTTRPHHVTKQCLHNLDVRPFQGFCVQKRTFRPRLSALSAHKAELYVHLTATRMFTLLRTSTLHPPTQRMSGLGHGMLRPPRRNTHMLTPTSLVVPGCNIHVYIIGPQTPNTC